MPVEEFSQWGNLPTGNFANLIVPTLYGVCTFGCFFSDREFLSGLLQLRNREIGAEPVNSLVVHEFEPKNWHSASRNIVLDGA